MTEMLLPDLAMNMPPPLLPLVSRTLLPESDSNETSASAMESRENVITLIDALGREFHTNLKASDLQYLVKYSIISSLRAELRNRDRKQLESRRLGSKTDALMLHGQSDTNAQRQPDSSGYECSSNAEPSAYKTPGAGALRGVRKRNAIVRGLKRKKCFQVLDDPLVHDLKDHLVTTAFDSNNGQMNEQVFVKRRKINKGSKKQTSQANTEDDSPDNQKNSRGKRCRKVYGTEQREKWCRQCKWKKSCARFADNVTGLEDFIDSPPPQPSGKRPRPSTSNSPAESPLFPPPCDLSLSVEAVFTL